MVSYYIGLTVLSITAGFAYGKLVGFAVLGVGLIVQASVSGMLTYLSRE